MADLFSRKDELERLPIVDGEVYYMSSFLDQELAKTMMVDLINHVSWRSEKITLWGKTFLQPRLIAWYGDQGMNYSYSGINLNPLPWTSELFELKDQIEIATSSTFNSVLLNYYRDNKDSMGFHSDDEPELGSRPIIASLSLGAERTFSFKHKKNKTLKTLKLKLASGSLLLMKGDTQVNWKHGIEKETKSCGPRVNLTFRYIKKK